MYKSAGPESLENEKGIEAVSEEKRFVDTKRTDGGKKEERKEETGRKKIEG